MPTALVRNGRVVTASESYDADLYVDGGRIALVGQGLSLPADTVLDASGCLVLPGGIDAHTHLDMPAGELTSADDFETGTRRPRRGRPRCRPRAGAGQSPRPSRRGEGRGPAASTTPRVREVGSDARRDDAARTGRGRDLVQAVPGLPRGPAGGRRLLLPGPPRGAGVRGAHPRPRKRRRHRRPREQAPARETPSPPALTRPGTEAEDRPGDLAGHDAGAPLYVVHLSAPRPSPT
jgi:hypothetical protein